MIQMINFIIGVISDMAAAMSNWIVVDGISLLALIAAIMIVGIIIKSFLS